MIINRSVVKESLWKSGFRNILISNDESLKDEIQKYFGNPGCSICFESVYTKIVKQTKALEDYFQEQVEIQLDPVRKPPEAVEASTIMTSRSISTNPGLAQQPNPFRKKTFLPDGYKRVVKFFTTENLETEILKYQPQAYVMESSFVVGDQICMVFLTMDGLE